MYIDEGKSNCFPVLQSLYRLKHLFHHGPLSLDDIVNYQLSNYPLVYASEY